MAAPRGGGRQGAGTLRHPHRARALREELRCCALFPLTLSYLGAAGERALMEDTMLEMGRLGLRIDSTTGGTFIHA